MTLYLGKLIFEEMLWLKILYLLEVITEKMMMGVLGMIIIRSQDRLDLMRVNRVEISNKQVCAVFEEESNAREIGRYKSEERAIEVLNMIQNAVIAGTKFDIINKDGVRCNKEKVFEMPVE
ncbi:TPA: hypothetical protein ACG3Q2_002225 [Clostridioides difficile]